MNKYKLIFDVLKDVRTYSGNNNMEAVLRAVEHAENMAMTEICLVDLNKPGPAYDALLQAMFPTTPKLL
jgi:hypothetical protein